jgi:hypothetical protein
MTMPDDVRAQRRLERAARRFTRGQRFAGDRGPGYSMRVQASTPWTKTDERDFWLNREIEMLQRALADRGQMRRSDLAKAVGGKYWGPRRFAQALRAAAARGAIRRTGLGRYGPAGDLRPVAGASSTSDAVRARG